MEPESDTSNVKDDDDFQLKLWLMIFVAGMIAGAVLVTVILPLIWGLIRLALVVGVVVALGVVIFKLKRSSRS